MMRAVEAIAGIGHGFHPDSLFYIEHSWEYVRDGVFSLSALNNFYYFLVDYSGANVELLIFFNQVIYAITNVILFRALCDKQFRLSIIQWLILLLPYRLHLSVHVLKDTIIIMFFVLSTTVSLRYLPAVIFMLTGFRTIAGPLAILSRFTIRKTWFLVLAYVCLLTAIVFIPTVAFFLSERSEADMGGRELFVIPLQNASGFAEIMGKSILWPILGKTGLFALFSANPIGVAIALEPLIFTVFAIKYRRSWIFFGGPGALPLVLISMLVTSFGAYYRYIYPFLIIDCLNMVKEKSDKKSFHAKNGSFQSRRI